MSFNHHDLWIASFIKGLDMNKSWQARSTAQLGAHNDHQLIWIQARPRLDNKMVYHLQETMGSGIGQIYMSKLMQFEEVKSAFIPRQEHNIT